MPLSSHEVLSNQLRTNHYINLSVASLMFLQTNKQTNGVHVYQRIFSGHIIDSTELHGKKIKKIKVINE